MLILSNLDLNKNELQKARIQNLATASAPATPAVGQIYYDTDLLAIRMYNGSAWTNKATDSLLLQGNNTAYHLARANHTGTQLAATISDFDTQVRLSRLDQMAAPTASVAFNSQKITGLLDGVALTDAATVGQVQAGAAGIDAKASVRFATTANITLSGLGTAAGRDWGSALTADDRVLVKNQTDATENGIYNAKSGAWVRSTDMDANSEYTPNAFTFVEESASSLATTQWIVSTAGPITIGSTSVTWVQFGAASVYTANATGGLTLSGNAFSVLLPANSGLVKDATGLYVDSAIVVKKYGTLVGDNSATTIVVTHNLNTRDVIFSVHQAASPYAVAQVDCELTSVNTLTLFFGTAPTTDEYRVVVHA